MGQAEPLSIVLSMTAAAIAGGGSLTVVWRRGLVIRKIESREHEWQSIDPKGANIEARSMRESFRTPPPVLACDRTTSSWARRTARSASICCDTDAYVSDGW